MQRECIFFLQFTSSRLIPSVSSPAQLVGYSRPGASGQVASWVMDRGHDRGAFMADQEKHARRCPECQGPGSFLAISLGEEGEVRNGTLHQPIATHFAGSVLAA